MASSRNDKLLERRVEGSVNYYQNHQCRGTAVDRGLAERLGGHSYNILSNTDKHEIYLNNMRTKEHVVDDKNRHTIHFFGARRRKFRGDERGHIQQAMTHPESHPREHARAQQRCETQLAQLENSNSYAGFQGRMGQFFAPPQEKKYQVHNARYANEVEKLRPQIISKGEYSRRRGETMRHCKSAPSVSIADPAASLARACREDARKEASQRQLESAHFAHRMSANTYTTSMDEMPLGKSMHAGHRQCSINRLENHDFGITRKNNHYSSEDKITRSDPYYMRPRLGITNNSVKYDMITNERRWFKY